MGLSGQAHATYEASALPAQAAKHRLDLHLSAQGKPLAHPAHPTNCEVAGQLSVGLGGDLWGSHSGHLHLC